MRKTRFLSLLLAQALGVALQNGPSAAAPDGPVSLRNGARPFNIARFGARCGGIQIKDGVPKAGSSTVMSASSKWNEKMVGWHAVVNNAAAGGRQLVSTVRAVTGSGSIVLADNAGASGSGETVTVYPDDMAALDKAIKAAAPTHAAIALPPGQRCGVVNSGHYNFSELFGSLYLNGGTLYLDQTGPSTDTGWGISFRYDGAGLVGPGTVDGLYQTNQGVAQFVSSAVRFDDTASEKVISNMFIRDVVVQNTKGRCIAGQWGKNFTMENVTVSHCGDFAYDHTNNPNDQSGRSMGTELGSYDGLISVRNYKAIDAAQAGILIEGFGHEPDTLHVTISDSSFSGNGYYGVDLEQLGGTSEIKNVKIYNQGYRPSGEKLYGGSIFRDIHRLHIDGYESTGTNSDALVIESNDSGGNLVEATIDNFNLKGSQSNPAAQAYIAVGAGSSGPPVRISLANGMYDNLTIAPNSARGCSVNQPPQFVISFRNIHANLRAKQSPADTNFDPQANPNTAVYFQGSDSTLGTVNARYASNNDKGAYYDWANVQTNGPMTFVGSATKSVAATAIARGGVRGALACP